ncbi:MAG: PadR family transcriptional regulator [Leuconostoc gelidum]|jgi:DNA-binding PadR family transcriptional regulator|uniref:PadR family transcriptional regulator n=1 Tax=Leuconostoc gelidum group TaxID=3016637 RepID=UPI00021939F8|nr:MULTISPECIES: transcriptional regulator [Leuconostoc gelidum group]MBZ5960832.1 PadR family transcriptional regulator [Leuconostoc gasicomitatum]MBZ5978261.1 PadR family transcriptional regulator [Leuconostoc gelidum subsp. gelidum]MBZ5991296.1 PadR family transcriptional regulator [Leuconostoc gelidum subsp. gelidum]MBZ5994682.1 PadR family transcriptional regulator [Leuconostoc gasicomitatum]MBZ5997406.1 PadR family transcriptional regulator [Leuconostoc gasicomitatum]
MYELYVLGQLLFTDRSAYKLRFVLENVLGINRKVSFGVLYPLLEKMENSGTIVMTNDLDWRGKKKLHVTAVGRSRFDTLMREPISKNAHMDDVYLFKLSSLSLVDRTLSQQIIANFRAEKQSQCAQYVERSNQLQLHHSEASFFKSAMQINKLQHALANTYLEHLDIIESELE